MGIQDDPSHNPENIKCFTTDQSPFRSCLPFAIQTAKDKLHKDGLEVASCTQQVSPFQPRERVSKHLLTL